MVYSVKGWCEESGKMAKPGKEFIVIFQQIVGGGPFETEYSTDQIRFDDRQKAIAHGLLTRGSDDFNIGVVQGKNLLAFDWMNKPVETEASIIDGIAAKLYL
jgi:hypothetical protein